MSRNFLKRLEHQTKYRKITRKPRGHVRILIYPTWAATKRYFEASIYSQNKFKPRVVYPIQARTSDLDTSICALIPAFKITRKL